MGNWYYKQTCNIDIEKKAICMREEMKVFLIHQVRNAKGNRRET
jgi:hypothetical protein